MASTAPLITFIEYLQCLLKLFHSISAKYSFTLPVPTEIDTLKVFPTHISLQVSAVEFNGLEHTQTTWCKIASPSSFSNSTSTQVLRA